tara:strand:+ start:11465 stop:11959 length:495 start_codon:yes stop_codon:yes gene_type:complete
MTDLVAHLTRQAAFSRATFGPGPRTKGVQDHIRKELDEIEDVYSNPENHIDVQPVLSQHSAEAQVHRAAAAEWTDVAILGLDGLTRAISAAHPDWHFSLVAAKAVEMIVAKQGKNELRDWPDWRTMSADKAIEHDRTKDIDDEIPHFGNAPPPGTEIDPTEGFD